MLSVEQTRLRALLDKKSIENMLKRLKYSSNKTILDVGCGPGGIWPILRKFAPEGKIYAFDIITLDDDWIYQYDVTFTSSDYRDLRYQDNFFDCIIARMVFDSVSVEQTIDLSELIRVAKNHSKVGIICKKDIMPIVTSKPRHYDKLCRVYRAMHPKQNNFYLEVLRRLRWYGIVNISVNIQVNDNVSFGCEELIRYYFPGSWKIENDAFYKTNLFTESELFEYNEDLKEIIRNPLEYVAFSQVHIVGEIQK